VPLRKGDNLLGAFAIYRQEVRPFSDKQIALLQNFAAQAVIAMENARLLTETREALEQQTATAEVLGVINSSPGDLAPVFDAMLDKAIRLCEATHGHLLNYDDECFHLAAVSDDPRWVEWVRQSGAIKPEPDSALGRLLRGEDVVHIPDVIDTDGYRSGLPSRIALVQNTGARTALWVALRKEQELRGAFIIYRREVRPFSDKEIALVENFAAQAVIAMENARLMTETREALEQQTATAEVLQVINSSPGDLTPVFDAMLEKATRLCDAGFGILWTFDGQHLRAVALYGVSAAFADLLKQPIDVTDSPAFAEIVGGRGFVQLVDLAASQAYRDGNLLRRATVDLGGAQTGLAVALRRDDALLGIFATYRQEVRPFTDKQIALLQNFAAQAVIAMENARLIAETREALEQQTATAEVLQVINSSPGDLKPVFDTMLEKALNLCDAAFGVLWTKVAASYQASALSGVPPKYADFVTREPRGPEPGGVLGRLVRGEALVHIPDTTATTPSDETGRTQAELSGARTVLGVSLRKDNAFLGAFLIYRKEVRPFTDKQIALLQNFAAQAVIAMENARLLTETREALDQQTATAEVLGVINSSPGDLAPVFDAMLEKATRLCSASHGVLRTFDGQDFPLAAASGEPFALERLRQFGPVRPTPGGAFAAIVAGEPVIHVADVRDTEQYQTNPNARQRSDLMHVRTWLAVALRREDTLLGMIALYRQEARPFSERKSRSYKISRRRRSLRWRMRGY